VGFQPDLTYFKPAGVPVASLEESVLTVDGFEAVRLKDLEGLEQEEAGERMGVSQPTFHRILLAARKTVADAIVNGKAIRIEGGVVRVAGTRRFMCDSCHRGWDVPFGTGRPPGCPTCRSTDIHRDEKGGACAGPRRGRCGRPR
jgi:predicted DNA-binding protein (UPF0251 family)